MARKVPIGVRTAIFEWACHTAATDRKSGVRARQTQMKGGIRHNGEESQGREEEGSEEALS